jgi:hypothetical protein
VKDWNEVFNFGPGHEADLKIFNMLANLENPQNLKGSFLNGKRVPDGTPRSDSGILQFTEGTRKELGLPDNPSPSQEWVAFKTLLRTIQTSIAKTHPELVNDPQTIALLWRNGSTGGMKIVNKVPPPPTPSPAGAVASTPRGATAPLAVPPTPYEIAHPDPTGANYKGRTAAKARNQLPPLANAATEATAQKMPWEMTRDEFGLNYFARGRNASMPIEGEMANANSTMGDFLGSFANRYSQGKGGEIRLYRNEEVMAHDFFKQNPTTSPPSITRTRGIAPSHITPGGIDPHKFLVEKALAEGKPIPAEVLADYPDLKPAPPTEIPTQAQQGTQLTGMAVKQGTPGAFVQPKLLPTQAELPPTSLQGKAPQAEHGELMSGFRPEMEAPPELPLVDAPPAPRVGSSGAAPTAQPRSLREIDLDLAEVNKELGFHKEAYAEAEGNAAERAAINQDIKATRKDIANLTAERKQASIPPKVGPPSQQGTKLPKVPPLLAGGAGRGVEELAATGSRPTSSTYWTKAELRPEHFEKATEIATEYLKQSGVVLKRTAPTAASPRGRLETPLLYQLTEVIDPQKADLPLLAQIAERQGMTTDQFYAAMSDAINQKGSGGGHDLNWLKQMSLRIAQEQGGTAAQQRSTIHRLGNIWRASLIGQLVTTERNLVSNTARLALHAVTDTIDVGLNKIVGVNRAQASRSLLEPLHNLAYTVKHSRSNRTTVEQLLARNPTLKGRLYGGYASDVSVPVAHAPTGPVDRLLTAWERGLNVVNAPNRVTEFYGRDIAFLTELKALLAQRGLHVSEDLSQAAGAGRVALTKDLEAATRHALDITFAAPPPQGSGADHLLKFYNKIPFPLVSEIPFPRFLYNAGKFTLEHTLWPVNLARPSTLKAIMGGNTMPLSKAIAGAGLFAAALAIRNSEYAGERFNEVTTGQRDPKTGKTRYWDMMPFNPWSSNLFAADVVTKFINKEPQKLDLREVMKGLVSVNLRAGTAHLVADKVFDLLGVGYEPDGSVTEASASRFLQGAKQFAGELTSGFAVPLLNIKAITQAVDPEEAKKRNTRTPEPFLGPIKNNIPFAAQGLPPKYDPTAFKIPKHENPIGKFATAGARAMEKTTAQQALDRHSISYRNVLPPQSSQELETALAEQMGPIVERTVTALIATPAYQRASFNQQTAMLVESVKAARGAAKPVAESKIPDSARRSEQLKRIPPHIRSLIP